MRVVFDKDNTDRTGGCVSMLSYQNPAFRKAMYEIFGIKNNELITKLVVANDGIKAYIETK